MFKVKSVPVETIKAYEELEVWLHKFFNLRRR